MTRPRELLFVIDSSGSMSGWPYESARGAVLLALDEMGPEDTFNLVRFSNAASSLFARPQHSTPGTRSQAREWLSDFSGGGTNMDAGIVHSLTMPGDPEAMRLVLLLTDGYVGGEDTMFRLVRRHLGDARMFSLGVGSSVNRYLLEGLAEMGRGDVIYHFGDQPLGEAVASFYDRIAHPALSDLDIDWGGLEVSEQYPAEIPDLWSGQPLRVVAKYEPTAAHSDGVMRAVITVGGVLGTEEVAWELPLEVPVVEPRHEGLGSIWARRKIRDIEWYPRGRSADEVRQDVTDVALDHHLVSKYTSLVAIDDEPSPCGPASLRVSVPNHAPAGVSMAGGAQLGQGGYGQRGTGLGGGGSALMLGALGTKGRSSGPSGYGVGGGHLSAHAAGVVGFASGSPIILGSLDKSLIDAVIKRHLNAIRYCYQRELQKQPALAGKVVMEFSIAKDGSVAKARVKSSTLSHQPTEACLVSRFVRMQFPPSPGGGMVVVNYPFVFTADD